MQRRGATGLSQGGERGMLVLLKAGVFGIAVSLLLAGISNLAAEEPLFRTKKTYVARGDVQLYVVRCSYRACGKDIVWQKDIASRDLEPKRQECRDNYAQDVKSCVTLPIPPSVHAICRTSGPCVSPEGCRRAPNFDCPLGPGAN